MADTAEPPAAPGSAETWRGMRDGSGYTAAYAVTVEDRLADTLARLPSYPATEIWTVPEITGTATRPELAVGCSLRTADRPTAGLPLPGLIPQRGRHRPALDALRPRSNVRLGANPVAVNWDLVEQLGQMRRYTVEDPRISAG